MVDRYTIYVVNKSSTTQKFWCFLTRPQELVSDPGVFANSAACVSIKPNYKGQVSFVIPVQYVVGAGASTQAIGMNVNVISSIAEDANIGDVWTASYSTVPEKMGPDLISATGAPANTLQLVSNSFDKAANEADGWFSNQSFGIQTQSGFMGMTWSPDPAKKRTLTPKLVFYVAVGDFGANDLASWNDVGVSSQTAQVPGDFALNKATVTYTSSGGWAIAPGAPTLTDYLPAATNDSVGLSASELELAALLYISGLQDQTDTLSSVVWDAADEASRVGDETKLSGTLTVNKALTAAFSFFVLAGTRFSVTGSTQGATRFRFSYSGPAASRAIKMMFVAGATLFFYNNKNGTRDPAIDEEVSAAV